MDLDKDMMLAIVGARASQNAAELSRQLLTAPAEELEAIQSHRRRGPQALGEILPAVLADLGFGRIQSPGSGAAGPT